MSVDAERPAAKSWYPWYVTGVLMVAYILSFLDRQILYLMVEPIKADLAISDFQFALLTGGAFGIFYTLMGLPIGWMADRYNRKNLIAVGITLWSVMTALCGLANSYAHLFLARIGVGVGEATLSPSAYSMLSDSFDKKRLPRAMSIYTFGLFIGAGLAMIIGGEVIAAVKASPDLELPLFGAMRSWHMVFIVVGLPGLAVALWVETLKEPARTGMVKQPPKTAGHFPFADVFAFIGENKLMSLSLFIGPAFFSVLAYSDSWYPELFIRIWGWNVEESGRINGVSSLIAGPIGLLFAGWLSSRWLAAGRTDACLRLTALGAVGIMIPAIAMPLMPTAGSMAFMLFPFKFFIGFTPVLIPSAIQMVAPNHLRAQLGAVFLFAVGIIGVSMGPILPAFLSDFVFSGDRALPHALATAAAVIGPVTFILLWVGMKQYRQRYQEMTVAESRQ
ncbi:MFS transporter [Niveispirillum sp. KHB5.9]|uniref:MFS transporter n=1 Tax=Niveispirillum sp. KHB5.9 TaxID=3400269 RepID=UPI003A843E1B